MNEEKLTQSRLMELFIYNEQTGLFYRKQGRKGGGFAGDQAGSNAHGYLSIMIDGINYRCHRLAWLYVYGEFPCGSLDHINRDKADNRIANLRKASAKQNSENRGTKSNNKSGYRGVYWNCQKYKWQAKIIHNAKQIHIGYFDDAIVASNAYQQKANELFTHFIGGTHG